MKILSFDEKLVRVERELDSMLEEIQDYKECREGAERGVLKHRARLLSRKLSALRRYDQ